MSTETSSTDLENRYKNTIDLPQTDFPMRGNGPLREPEFQAKWFGENIYERTLDALKDQELFVLHDGPPYLSSDKIHIGTALNKILKDIIIKYKTQRGYKTPYIPGYDSHGLPIETAVVKEIKGGRAAVTVLELRDKCKDFALKNLKGQETNFKRLGILGDWEHPYITLAPDFEAEQIRVFAEMAAKGYIYRGLKPVYWSYGAETALADAEVEYNEEHTSTAIYVAFKITNREDLKDTSIVIWTTTPWTIPGNLAICLSKDLDYQVYKTTKIIKDKTGAIVERIDLGKTLIAAALAESYAKDAKVEIEAVGSAIKGSELEGTITSHPLHNRPSPVIFGGHVTTEAGTGCVHTAPGHGQEDFIVAQEYGISVICPVDGKGNYTSEAGSYTTKNNIAELKMRGETQAISASTTINLEGLHVINEGNDIICALLRDAGALVSRAKIKHSYPYCWRSKTPLLYRATQQWFASVDGFRDAALKAIDGVEWIPERGRNRIYPMVAERGDWCISRQRTWGVPIPVFYDKTKIDTQGNPAPVLDLELIEHVAKIFETEGSSAWYARSVAELLPSASKYKAENLVKETDTMDVWFDSGSTHRAVVAKRLSPNGKFRAADLYLEGSDQHRGWFQSSLLTSVATNGCAPYKSVLTHGFVMDEHGHKMSKSRGNVVDPQDVIKNYGADILRLWVASVDYSMDIKVGDTMFKQLSDIYRNLRNTSRYILGNLHDFDPAQHTVSYDKLWDLDRLILHRLQLLVQELTQHFDKYQFFKYYQLLQNFCSVDLSAFYFDILKDRLYTHGTNSLSRRAAQTVLTELLATINRLFVPVLPHLAEDIYQFTPAAVRTAHTKSYQHSNEIDSVLASKWPSVRQEYLNIELAIKWDQILELRELSNKSIEELRKQGLIGKSLEATVTLGLDSATLAKLEPVLSEVQAVFIVSELKLHAATNQSIKAEKFNGEKCVRCWKLFEPVIIQEGICLTCSEAVKI